MIELGGNIKLEGFDEVEPAQLIVIKKVVGNFARQYSEKTEVKELLVKLEKGNKVSISLKGDKEITEKDDGDNLFFVLDGLLVKIRDQLWKAL